MSTTSNPTGSDPITRPVLGYRRANGKVGIRNHVVILPIDDGSNTAAEAVGRLVQPTVVLSHSHGRLQFGDDFDLLYRTLIGTVTNPNVAAVVVIGQVKPVEKVVAAVTESGTPVEGVVIEARRELAAIEEAAAAAMRFVHQASEIKREPVALSEMIFTMKCSESDTTSGLASNPALGVATDRLVNAGATMLFGETSEFTGVEEVLARRMEPPELGERFLEVQRSYVAFLKSAGVDLLGTQPAPVNIRGGVSTIEEKALGTMQKTGTCPIVDVLESAEQPRRTGLQFMDTSCATAECITSLAASGSALHLLTTGLGNIVGHPVVPVLKMCANPRTIAEMSEHIEVDISDILTEGLTLEEAGDRIIDMIRRTAEGRLTATEMLGHREFTITKLHRSA
jgi:(2R)-sulfolactate sulfo-lyase subunit beta